MKKTGLLFVLFFPMTCGLLSCQMVSQRSSNSGYGDVPPTKSGWSPQQSTVKHQSLSERPWAQLSIKSKLRQLESGLVIRKDLEQYSRWLPWFRTDEEKVEFLSLPGFEARQKWLSESDMDGRVRRIAEEMKTLIDSRDIAVGMPDQFVKQSWGEPDQVEVSGQPEFRNYRWRFNRYLSTTDGYKNEKKTVYLEGGKVVGWEVE